MLGNNVCKHGRATAAGPAVGHPHRAYSTKTVPLRATRHAAFTGCPA